MLPARVAGDSRPAEPRGHWKMLNLTPAGQQVVANIANRYGVSQNAVEALLVAVNAGGGSMAQFSHPELGGMGQWSRGGMIMIGDMFNNGLKASVDGICTELSNALVNQQIFAPVAAPAAPMASQSQYQGSGNVSFSTSGFGGGSSWPAELGQPSSTGSQNNLRYAVFPSTRRLAIDVNGQITVYDIGDHQIGGFSQQQGGDQTITFTSQYGTVRVSDLPVVTLGGATQPAAQPAPQSSPQSAPEPAGQANAPANPAQAELLGMIEKLASLHKQGVLTDAEFEAKKADLLGRL